jgi:FSR family fosmidomycin resistance protein-like MFS transporter
VRPARRLASGPVNRRALALLSAGHLAVDACQGVVPALLPFLIADRGWSYGQAAALVLAATVASSVIQPLFGWVSDHRPMAWLMPAGVAVAGLGIALVGLLPSYGATFAVVVVSGVGVAAYHPEASRFARYVSGERRATGMSLFSVGGNAGLALGPLMATPLVLVFGLHGTIGLLVVPLIVAAVQSALLPRLGRLRPPPPHPGAPSPGVDEWGAFSRLSLAIVLRSWVYFGMSTFVPLYFVAELGASKTDGNLALTVMLAAGAVGTLLGGPLADRIGPRAVFAGSMALLPALLVAFLLAGPVVAIFMLAAIGCVTIATFSVGVVLSQEMLPGHLGIASGVSLGLSIGLGGVGASLLGILADAIGLRPALEVLAAIPLLALALALTLPRRRPAAAPAMPA